LKGESALEIKEFTLPDSITPLYCDVQKARHVPRISEETDLRRRAWNGPVAEPPNIKLDKNSFSRESIETITQHLVGHVLAFNASVAKSNDISETYPKILMLD